MNKMLLTGAALILFAAAMGTCGRAAAYPIDPTKPCAASNDGDVTMIGIWRLPEGSIRTSTSAKKTAGC